MGTARRRRWLAGLLSLFAAPAGQIYNGQPRKGIALFLCVLGLATVFAVVSLARLPLWVGLAIGVLCLSLQIVLVVDAIVQAGRAGAAYRLRPYNRWFLFLPLLAAAWLAPRLWVRAIQQLVETYAIPSASNEPTVLVGDHLLVQHLRHAHPRRGELVVFRSPERPEILIIKRAVAVGGDRVEIRDQQLFLNGRPLAEPYAIHTDFGHIAAGPEILARRDQLPAQTIPAGFVFMLGDNRDFSWDSRFYGPVPEASVIGGGRIRVYWSWDAARHAPRWERTGLFLQ